MNICKISPLVFVSVTAVLFYRQWNINWKVLSPNEVKDSQYVKSKANSSSDGNFTSSIRHVSEMRKKNLHLSIKQQTSFFTMKDITLSWLKQFDEDSDKQQLLSIGNVRPRDFGYILNEKYAFRHIFKNGGTTVGIQVHKEFSHDSQRRIGKRNLIASIRDPIEHFLSGWAECAVRDKLQYEGYDDAIFNWFQKVKQCKGRSPCRCFVHGYPQAGFLLQLPSKTFLENIDLIGDVKELPDLLEFVGFEFNRTLGFGRVAKDDDFKKELYPRNRDLLSNRTIDALCQYLALDYYIFDHTPPPQCKHQIETDIASIKEHWEAKNISAGTVTNDVENDHI